MIKFLNPSQFFFCLQQLLQKRKKRIICILNLTNLTLNALWNSIFKAIRGRFCSLSLSSRNNADTSFLLQSAICPQSREQLSQQHVQATWILFWEQQRRKPADEDEQPKPGAHLHHDQARRRSEEPRRQDHPEIRGEGLQARRHEDALGNILCTHVVALCHWLILLQCTIDCCNLII